MKLMIQKTKVKQTEIRVIPENWELTKLSNAIDINPNRLLKKGVSAKKVSMDCLATFNKKIQSFEYSNFTGGSKFINGDTLMARITPCLENGKISFVDILNNDEVGFGSTEFIVLSKKENKTINEFVYYLSISPFLRDNAIQSMTGTSGRQRVQTDLFGDVEIPLPSLPEQQAIAKILSDLDDKIELNKKMNQTLEEIGKNLFKRWFIDFEFPNEKGQPYKLSGGKMVYNEELKKRIPKGWNVDKLEKLSKIQPGYAFKSDDFIIDGIKVIKIRNIQNNTVDLDSSDHISVDLFNNTDKKFYLSSGDIIIAMTGAELGKIGVFPKIKEIMVLNQRVGKVVSNKAIMYLYLNTNELQELMKGISSTSSAQGNISNIDIEKVMIPIPNNIEFNKYNDSLTLLFNRIVDNLGQNIILSNIKDSLLPKLMSGKIRVKY